jgi:hypothetical protein
VLGGSRTSRFSFSFLEALAEEIPSNYATLARSRRSKPVVRR